jgi:hypothetical protein
VCNGDCGTEKCVARFNSNNKLRRHIDRKKKEHACPVTGCTKRYGCRSHMVDHARLKHPKIFDEDGGSELYGINSKRTPHLLMPSEFKNKLSTHEWQFIKELVSSCLSNDMREKKFSEKDKKQSELLKNNQKIHEIATALLRYMISHNMITGPFYDDAVDTYHKILG